MEPRTILRVLLVLVVNVRLDALQLAGPSPRISACRPRSALRLSESADDSMPAFTFESDTPSPLSIAGEEGEEMEEVEFSFESEQTKTYLDGFAPRPRESDVQAGLEAFSLGSAADDLAKAAATTEIPIAAVGLGLVSTTGLVYVVSTLLLA